MTKPKKTEATRPMRSEYQQAAIEEYEKGLRLLHQKDFQKAIPRFQAVIDNWPDETGIGERARQFLSIARGEHSAKKPARETRDPADCYAVGVYLLNDGEVKEAMRHLQRAVEHSPQDASVHVALAIAQLECGDKDGCLRSVAKAVELDPAQRVKLRNLTDFEDLEDEPEFAALTAPLEN